KEKIYLLAVFVGMMMNVSANFLLIRRFGIEGAAVASIMGEVIVSAIAIYHVYFRLNLKVKVKPFLVSSISSFVLVLTYILLSNFSLSNLEYLSLFGILSLILYLTVQVVIFKNVEVLYILSKI